MHNFIHKSLFLASFIAVTLIHINLCFGVLTNKPAYEKETVEVSGIIRCFSDPDFNDHLKELTGYSFQEHESAILSLHAQYKEDYNRLEECARKASDKTREYSDKWLKDLIKKFGKAYISENRKSISNLIRNLFLKKNKAFCLQYEKEAIYSEILFIKTLKDLNETWLKYYNSLDDNEKTRFANSKRTIEKTNEILSVYPVQEITFSYSIGGRLPIKTGVTVKQEVVDFIQNHEQFSRPFSPIKAIDDLLRLTGNQ